MRRTVALIIFLIIITAGLVVLALQSNPQKKTPPTTVSVHPTPVADTVIGMNPNPVQFSASGSATVAITVDSGMNVLSGVQLEIAYDPTQLAKIAIVPGNFFQDPVILLSENNTQNGRISYALGIAPGGKPMHGSGTVALLSFVRAPAARGAESTISILDKSLVTMLGTRGSVLKQTSGTTVLFSLPSVKIQKPTLP